MRFSVQRSPIENSLPFDLGEVKQHCRVDFEWFDAELTRMALSAARELEDYAGIALLKQSITVSVVGLGCSTAFDLPITPLLSPASVALTIDGSSFEGFTLIPGQRPYLLFSAAVPSGLLVIEYEAGFGETVLDLPDDIRTAICDQAASQFDLKGPGNGKLTGMSPHMARIAARYRRVTI